MLDFNNIYIIYGKIVITHTILHINTHDFFNHFNYYITQIDLKKKISAYHSKPILFKSISFFSLESKIIKNKIKWSQTVILSHKNNNHITQKKK